MPPQNGERPATERTVNGPQMSSSGGVDIPTNKRSLREFQAKVLARRSRLRPDRARLVAALAALRNATQPLQIADVTGSTGGEGAP
jgi:hypothetical protein